ncbi:hypothetical protein GCM10027346_33130 [Hymenobacter seoulensis]
MTTATLLITGLTLLIGTEVTAMPAVTMADATTETVRPNPNKYKKGGLFKRKKAHNSTRAYRRAHHRR